MLKVVCDRCKKEISEDEEGCALQVNIERNTSWERYGQLVFCETCIKSDKTLTEIVERLE